MWRLIWTCVVGRCTLIVRNEIMLRRIIHKNLRTYYDRNSPYSRERTMYSFLFWFKKKKIYNSRNQFARESVASDCKPRHIILTTHKINFQVSRKKEIRETRAPFYIFLHHSSTSIYATGAAISIHLPDRKSSRYRFEHATTWLDKIASTHKECLALKWHGDTLVRKYVYRKFELAGVTGSRIIAQALNSRWRTGSRARRRQDERTGGALMKHPGSRGCA